MSCLNMIIDHLGSNDYKILHMTKSKMEQEGSLHTVLQVTDAVESLVEMMVTMTLMAEADTDEEDDSLENTNL